jgi:DNA-binding NarL/FixJ family response regulator
MLAEPETLKPYLTSRQFEVVELLYMGFDRKGVAASLMPPTCVQAVHQIILRIRKRLKGKKQLVTGRSAQYAN